MPTAWPELHDLENLLISMGFSDIEVANDGTETTVCSFGYGIVRNSVIDAAVGLLEQETGFSPLLASGSTPSAILHDPPGARGGYYGAPAGGGRLLLLERPAVTISAVTVGGVVKTANVDWHPVYTTDRVAVTALEFLAPIIGGMRSVSVSAVWGRFATVPGDLWDCALRLAASMCIQEAREGFKALPVRWQEGDVSESYGELMLREAGDGLRAAALKGVERYKNSGVWF